MPIRKRLISSEKEKKLALDFRQKHFFDRLNIQDPYAWALDQKDHLHWLLYDGGEVIGYAHVQMWPDHRAALRIIVIDEQNRGSGMGKYLMDHCEQELKQRGVTLFQTEASPNAYLFYKKLGYIDMPFNNPVQLSEEALRRELHKAALGGADLIRRPFASLSVGQRKRLMLLSIILERPNVLLLDEPTNHLDFLTLEAFETALLNFEGAILAVSHDSTFIEKIATHEWRL